MSGPDDIERVRRAYAERDAAPATIASAWADPAYRFYIQRLEWLLLRALDRAGVGLAGAHALEVGCGSGYYANRLSEYGAQRVAGIDLMEARIAAARERHPQLELVAGDASALPWADGEFDVVTQFTCLSAMADPALRAGVAAEMWRVLRPGGVVLSFDIVRPHRALLALRRVRRRGAPAPVVAGTPTYPVSPEELRTWFAGASATEVVHISDGAGGLARRNRWLAELASTVPLLRSHLLFSATKPA